MVFTSLKLLMRARGPDEFWRKRKIFKLSAHFRSRTRNCYSLAIRAVHRSLQKCTLGRLYKKKDVRELWDTRMDAACEEQEIPSWSLKDGLNKYEILLSHKTLSEVSAWEPRTFRSLASIAALKTNHHVKNDANVKHIFLTDNIEDYERQVKK